MTTFAIGDIHGKYDCLQGLLDKVQFDPDNDTLWCTGDLVNRGKQSYQTLKFCQQLKEKFIMTLGNHDVSLLAFYHGYKSDKTPSSTTLKIFAAEDVDSIMQWLKSQPFLHIDHQLNTVLVHAGLPPYWSLSELESGALELQNFFSNSKQVGLFLEKKLMGNHPKVYGEVESDFDRYRYLINCFTRMRYLRSDGSLSFKHKGRPPVANRLPWFDFNIDESLQNYQILFGHWATLAYFPHLPQRVVHLDTACAYGGDLTAICLDGCPVRGFEASQLFHFNCKSTKK